MITPELQKKIDQAIKLLQQAQKAYPDEWIEIAYSGGKDSDVILQLAKEAGINYRAIYKNTTIDPPGTIQHVREMGVEIQQPQKPFFDIIKEAGLPNRFRRTCCGVLKEYKILDVAVQGIRKSESTKRNKMYQEPQVCRKYDNGNVKVFYPILTWTDEDVLLFIKDRNITIAPVYYDKNGGIDITKRLGCLCCPLQSRKNRLKAFKDNPKILKGYIRALKVFRDTHPDSLSCKNYEDEYQQIVRDLFFEKQKKFEKFRTSRVFGKVDCKKHLENYFKIKL